MKTRFDWHTVEDNPKEGVELTDRFPPSDRKLGCMMLSLSMVAIILGTLVWLVNDTQSEAVAGVREDVLLALELKRQAVKKNDKELFSAMLSSVDPVWKRNQQQLFAANLFNDRGVFGFHGDATWRDQSVHNISPDLQKAEVSFVTDYSAVTNSRNTPDLKLAHRLVFRFEDGRWKHSPAENSFWGPWGEVEREYITITFPARDAELAQYLADLIDAHLQDLCSNVYEKNPFSKAFCQGKEPWYLRLSIDERTLLNFSENSVTRSSEFDFEIPAPTLVGVPLSEKDWDVYFDVYAESLLQKMEMALLTTAPFPDQHIYGLCFNHPLRGRNLYSYDWHLGSWQSFLPQQTFHYLSALPDDSAIMLANNDIITVIDENVDSNFSDPKAVWQRRVPALDLKILSGWIDTADSPYLLIHEMASGGASTSYGKLDLHKCGDQECLIAGLPGYPVASNLSEASLFVNGSEIFLRKNPEDPLHPVGIGFNPFWIDGERFGFVRFKGEPDTGITTEVVLGDLAGSELLVLFDGYDLSKEVAIPSGSLLYVHDVTTSPVDPDLLLLSSTGIRDYSGNYFIFSLDISDSQNQPALKLEVARSGSMGSVPGILSPTGPPTLLVSPNGRWLAMSELNSQDKDTWTILLHDLLTGITEEVSKGVPAMPGNFPLLDWSGDGQWLLIADRDFLHLIAPGHEYEEVVAHDFDACSQLVWAE